MCRSVRTLVALVVVGMSGCGPVVSSETQLGGGDTGSTTGGSEGGSSGVPLTPEEWSAHCRSIQTEEACDAQDAVLAAGYAHCAWVRWHEVLDEDTCDFGEVVVEDCSANIFGGDSSPSPSCDNSSGLFICRRDDLPSPVIGVSQSPCGEYDWCSTDDPVCECACELSGG